MGIEAEIGAEIGDAREIGEVEIGVLSVEFADGVTLLDNSGFEESDIIFLLWEGLSFDEVANCVVDIDCGAICGIICVPLDIILDVDVSFEVGAKIDVGSAV